MAVYKETSSPAHGRHHSHTVSLGAVNPNNRVSRRKSINSASVSAASAAAVAAMIGDGNSNTSAHHLGSTAPSPALPVYSHRRGPSARRADVKSTSVSTPSAVSPAADAHAHSHHAYHGVSAPRVATKQRSRRASEGSQLIRGEGRRLAVELKCDRCGKGYKHSSCLTKHMWEHDPAWAYTSKLLISKHQQVQLLEAASVLVNMNPDTQTIAASDRSSASSGVSDLRSGLSSNETSPPPMSDDCGPSAASSLSRSYASTALTGSSAPTFSSPPRSAAHWRNSSVGSRPSTAEPAPFDDDEAGLAAAIGLCNFGTPRSGPIKTLADDVPPVPPLPARYLGQSANNSHPVGSGHGGYGISLGLNSPPATASLASTSTPTAYNPLHASLSYKVSDLRGRSDSIVDDDRHDDDHSHAHAHTHVDDDDDEGVFGRMEE